jgi:type I restriction enzyme M protein
MEHDGFSLDDKRNRIAENDIADVLSCWKHRTDRNFISKREKRLGELKK